MFLLRYLDLSPGPELTQISLCPFESAFQDGKNCHPDLRDDNLRLAVFNLYRRRRAKSFLLLP